MADTPPRQDVLDTLGILQQCGLPPANPPEGCNLIFAHLRMSSEHLFFNSPSQLHCDYQETMAGA